MLIHIVFLENHYRFIDLLQINIYKLIPINWLYLDKDSYQKVHPLMYYGETFCQYDHYKNNVPQVFRKQDFQEYTKMLTSNCILV